MESLTEEKLKLTASTSVLSHFYKHFSAIRTEEEMKLSICCICLPLPKQSMGILER